MKELREMQKGRKATPQCHVPSAPTVLRCTPLPPK